MLASTLCKKHTQGDPLHTAVLQPKLTAALTLRGDAPLAGLPLFDRLLRAAQAVSTPHPTGGSTVPQ